jgi:P27 family predicted phage terminase small subunit
MNEALPATLPRATKAARAIYKRTKPRLEALGVDWSYEELIRQYCTSIAIAEAAAKELDESGTVTLVSEKTGGKYMDPAMNVLNSANKESRAAGQALGLVPKTKDVRPVKQPENVVDGPASFQRRKG